MGGNGWKAGSRTKKTKKTKGNDKRSCRGEGNYKQVFVESPCSVFGFVTMNTKMMERGAFAARGDDDIANEAFTGFGGDEAPSKRVGTMEGGKKKTKDEFA